MTYFERYFERLDGPDPHSSLELVADDVEFSIQWAAGDDRRSSQFLGGLDELRGLHRRRRHARAGRITSSGPRRTATSSSPSARRAGTSRGERIGTFLAVAQLDADGRMRRYMVARSPALTFPSTAVEASDAGSA